MVVAVMVAGLISMCIGTVGLSDECDGSSRGLEYHLFSVLGGVVFGMAFQKLVGG